MRQTGWRGDGRGRIEGHEEMESRREETGSKGRVSET